MDLGPSKAEKERRGMIDRAEASNNRADTERTKARRDDIAQGIAQEVAHTGGEVGGLNDPEFHNYKPPRRLLALEIIVIILLIMLLLINPNGLTAISMKGTDTVGLLSSCSGGTCTSWLGAPAGGSTTATPAAAAPAPAEKRAPSDSTSTSTSDSSPTAFHLQTGLAAFCSFILLLYGFAFHLLRLRTPPPREGKDPGLAERTSWLRRKLRLKMDFSGFKRYGYRVSRLFIGADVILLLCVCISAGVRASSGGFNAGFVLLVIAWVLLFLVALIEFLDEGRKIRGWLMFKKGWGRGGSEEKKKGLPVHAKEVEQKKP